MEDIFRVFAEYFNCSGNSRGVKQSGQFDDIYPSIDRRVDVLVPDVSEITSVAQRLIQSLLYVSRDCRTRVLKQ